MATTAPKNPIVRRIDQLAESWMEFVANPEARMLRWLIDNDSGRLVDLFLELQNEEASEIPDLFLRFHEPFKDAREYGRVLRESLLAQYEEIQDGIAGEGIDATWSPPARKSGASDIEAFVQTSASLQQHYDEILHHFVPVLSPFEVADHGAWVSWLERLLASDIPPTVRFLVVDSAASPALGELAAKYAERIVTSQPRLDMPGAYAELVRDIPGSGPGFTFRRLFVALSNAAAIGNLAAAQQAADRALKIASNQKWPQMETVVYMALGAAYFAAGNFAATRESYRKANQAIAGSGDMTAPKLDIQTRFAEASVSIAEENYDEAAQLYAEIAPIAEKQQEHFAHLESRRMEAYCFQASERYDEAWQAGQLALDAGALLEEDVRRNCTLPYVGQGLLQLVQAGHVTGDEQEIRRRLEELVGADWENMLERGAAAS